MSTRVANGYMNLKCLCNSVIVGHLTFFRGATVSGGGWMKRGCRVKATCGLDGILRVAACSACVALFGRVDFAFGESVIPACTENVRGSSANETCTWKMFNRRLGLFVHWGIYSVGEWHEQERMRLGMARVEYEQYAARFAAEKFASSA